MQLFSRSRPSASCIARAATVQALAAATTLALLAGCATPAGPGITTPAVRVADGTQAKLALLETTDLHTNILSYDYYKLGEDRSVGFERTAALIAAARKEFANTLLFDNGDTIQGTALSDYQAQVKRLGCNEVLAMYKVMNALGYDACDIDTLIERTAIEIEEVLALLTQLELEGWLELLRDGRYQRVK